MKLHNKVKLYTGSYNSPILTGDGSVYHGRGEGIRVFLFDEETGVLEALESYPEVENASWITFSPDGNTLYAVNELDDYEGTKGGALSSLAVDEEGRLSLRNRLPVMGAAPCHVSYGQEHVFTANYNGGSLSSFTVNKDGSLKGLDWYMVNRMGKGERPKGIDRVRQEKPHVHSASVYEDVLWITDLGMDEVASYDLDGKGRTVPISCCKLKLPAGSGPRSLAFGREGYVYVSCELSNRIAILDAKGEEPELEGLVSSLPEGENGRGNLPGGILISGDGRHLYVGNRGHNSIGVFQIDPSGRPEGIQWAPCGGENPRGFQLSPSGRWLIAANQDSDNLVVFRRDEETGMLAERGRYDAGAVVCLTFLI